MMWKRMWEGSIVALPCPHLEYVALAGMWSNYGNNLPEPSASDIVDTILQSVRSGRTPSLR